MRKLINRSRAKALVKILFAIIIETLVWIIGIGSREEIGITGVVIVIGLWSIVFVIYFFSGIRQLSYGTKQLYSYMKRSGLGFPQLDQELEQAQKFGSFYIGRWHMFAVADQGVVVIPMQEITEMLIRRYRGRGAGYYYLYINGANGQKMGKIYSAKKNPLQAGVAMARQYNPDIVITEE